MGLNSCWLQLNVLNLSLKDRFIFYVSGNGALLHAWILNIIWDMRHWQFDAFTTGSKIAWKCEMWICEGIDFCGQPQFRHLFRINPVSRIVEFHHFEKETLSLKRLISIKGINRSTILKTNKISGGEMAMSRQETREIFLRLEDGKMTFKILGPLNSLVKEGKKWNCLKRRCHVF